LDLQLRGAGMTLTRRWFLHHISDVVPQPHGKTTEVLLPTTSGGYIPVWVRSMGEPRPWSMGLRARICAAAFVLTGRAVALQWPKDGELELAYHGKPNEPLHQAVWPVDGGDAA
jgi:hypothetical protein